ncbi:hypothetical protein [Sabulicella rubraurantiaca]|uniref:hypothetical protein n=1 Tax=Sabulicella rubraurantiaca TaxID=2811429 RepID=UPI001A96B8AB|nr:hypothetical protein [Sabulicella rubraurantiaca]
MTFRTTALLAAALICVAVPAAWAQQDCVAAGLATLLSFSSTLGGISGSTGQFSRSYSVLARVSTRVSSIAPSFTHPRAAQQGIGSWVMLAPQGPGAPPGVVEMMLPLGAVSGDPVPEAELRAHTRLLCR